MTGNKTKITRMVFTEIGTMTFYGNGTDTQTAAKHVLREIKGSEGVLGTLRPDAKLRAMVFDYTEYDSITWSDMVFTGKRPDGSTETIEPIERIVMDAKGHIIETQELSEFTAEPVKD